MALIRWRLLLTALAIGMTGTVDATKAVALTLKCGTLIDGISNVERHHVLVELSGATITGIRTYDQSDPKASGPGFIDLSGETCLPGLIDTHVHYIKTASDAIPMEAKPLQPMTADNFRRALNFGFTTLRNLGSLTVWPSDVELRKGMENGLLVGPRLQVSLNGIGPKRDLEVKGPEALRAVIDRMIAGGADWVKVYGDIGWEDPPRYSVEELTAIVNEAHSKGIKVAMHSTGPEDNHRAISCGVDSIEHGVQIRNEDLRSMRKKGTVLVPTLSALKYVSEIPDWPTHTSWLRQYRFSVSTFQRALKEEVKIAFGTDAAASSIENTSWGGTNPAIQLGLMVDLHMDPMSAIKSGTSVAAELLGMQNQIGSIAIGKLGDIIAVPEDPLKNIRQLQHVDFVMKDGKRIS